MAILDRSFFVEPVALTLNSSSTMDTGRPAINSLNDEPFLVSRINATTGFIIVQVPAGSQIDCAALLCSNLRATDTVRVRCGTSAANTVSSPVYDSGNVAAFQGNKAPQFRTKTVIQIPTVQTALFWRFDITATGHPDGFIQFAKVLLGKQVSSLKDMEYSFSQKVVDGSVVYEGAGYMDYDVYPVQVKWTAPFSYIPMDLWHDTMLPFLHRVGNHEPVLFVITDLVNGIQQNNLVYGRFVNSELGGECYHYDGWRCELEILSLMT